jgi:hypothetical protein
MDLPLFVAELVSPTYASPIAKITGRDQAFARIAELAESEQSYDALLASIFWQIVLASPLMPVIYRDLNIFPSPSIIVEPVIVPQETRSGFPRFDLVLFHTARASETQVMELSQTAKTIDIESALREGTREWRTLRRTELARAREQGRPASLLVYYYRLIDAIDDNTAIDVFRAADFAVVGIHLQYTEFTTTLTPPALGIACSGQTMATAGVPVCDASGAIGITTARHAVVGPASRSARSVQVMVDSVLGTVTNEDVIQDCCFIELPTLPSGAVTQATAGPLKGVSPRHREQVAFSGIGSGSNITTYITGWSPEIPFIFSLSQLKVFTPDVTTKGDSGAPLINNDGHILGYALFHTGLSWSPSFSAWVWADAVFNALNITAL